MSETRRLLEAAHDLSQLLRARGVPHAFYGSVFAATLSNAPQSDVCRSAHHFIRLKISRKYFVLSKPDKVTHFAVSEKQSLETRTLLPPTRPGPVGKVHLHVDHPAVDLGFRSKPTSHISSSNTARSGEHARIVSAVRFAQAERRLRSCQRGKQDLATSMPQP